MLGFGRLVGLAVLSIVCMFGDDAQPKGVHPRATPDDYAVKAISAKADYAVSLIPAEQAKHLFAFDITQKFVVFEVACFPKAGEMLAVDPDDFAVKHGDKGELTHEADPTAVAVAVEKENVPKAPGHSTEVVTQAHVGYESEIDPVTGQRVHGVNYGGGVWVQRGEPTPPDYPRPGGLPGDRDLLERQLKARELPTGKFDHVVAGYLYFSRAALKKDSNGNYQLEHLGESDLKGLSETTVIDIPVRNK